MIFNKKINLILSLFLFIYFSCTKEYTNNLNYLKEPILVIDAFINDITLPPISYYNYKSYNNSFDKKIVDAQFKLESVWEKMDSYVKLRLSKSLFTNVGDDSTLITNALVILKDDLGNVDTMREISDPLYIPTNNRFTKKGEFRLQKIKPSAGRTYTLEVLYNNKKYIAQSNLQKVNEIDSIIINHINFNGSGIATPPSAGYQPIIYVKQTNAPNYYLFKQVKDAIPDLAVGSFFDFDWLTNVLKTENNNYGVLDGYNINTAGGKSSNYNYLNEGVYKFDILLNHFDNYKVDIFYLYDKIKLVDKYEKKEIQLFATLQIYFGSIDEKGYNYINALNKLFKSDGGNYSPTPNTPQSNFSNGALGFFYTSSGKVFDILISNNNQETEGVDGTFKIVTVLKNGEHIFSKNSNYYGVVFPEIRKF